MVFLSQCFKEKDRIINFTRESYSMEKEFVLFIDFEFVIVVLIVEKGIHCRYSM